MTVDAEVPDITDPTWPVLAADGPVTVVHDPVDDENRVKHLCSRVARFPEGRPVICAPALDPGHVVTFSADNAMTIEPSLLCPDCGLHGWLRDGKWVAA